MLAPQRPPRQPGVSDLAVRWLALRQPAAV